MGLNSDIVEIIAQIDKTITGKSDKWFNISDYDLKIKDRKNMKSVYGLVHNILNYGTAGQRIIDRTHKDNLEYLYEKCVGHVNNLS